MKKLLLLILLSISIVACKNDDDNGNSCDKATNLNANNISEDVVLLSWSNINPNIIVYEVEYGLLGFELGNGTIIQASETNIGISNLISNTIYQFYVTTRCTDNNISISEPKSFTTSGSSSCEKVESVEALFPKANSVTLVWSSIDDADSYEVEYGLSGFDLGSGNTIISDDNNIDVFNLSPDTLYDVYIRAKCMDAFGEYSDVYQFTTGPLCNAPYNLTLIQVNQTNIQIAFNSFEETAFQIEYGPVGFELGNGTILNTSKTNLFINSLEPDTTYELYLRSNCGSNGFSEYTNTLIFTTS